MSPNYGYNKEKLKKEQLSPGLIRLSIGSEEASQLISDLKQSLDEYI
ncbi:MAG TPA: hypothetical protein VEY51_06620 [Chondromyces sp.]|nr:hypothetical protein [Chondromyces sp.]